jgi:hypothetical protein
VGRDDATDTVAIGKRQGRKTKMAALLDQLVGVARPLEEGEITLAPEWNVRRPFGR